MTSHHARIPGDTGTHKALVTAHLGISREVFVLRLCLTGKLPVFSETGYLHDLLLFRDQQNSSGPQERAQGTSRTMLPAALGLVCNKHLLGLTVHGGPWAHDQSNPCK